MIREYMKSHSNRDLVIITNVNEVFLNELEEKLHFSKDKRIRFVGTVYDQELLKAIREEAYGYFHGHEVGGTNPSLLEALASSDLNLLLDVDFNKEVGEDTAIYWNKEKGNLAVTIERAEALSENEIKALANASTGRIENAYSWKFISNEYAKVWAE